MIVFDVQQELFKGGKRLSSAWLDRLARSIDQELSKSLQGMVSVAFVSSPRMRTLTKQYRGDDHVSDILTFPFVTPRRWKTGEMVGEILLCYPQIIKQAKINKINSRAETAFLLAHGILHLQGKTHSTQKKLADMIRLQKAILARAGMVYPV